MKGMEWATVATAPDQLTAEAWLQLLRQHGIPSRLMPADAVSFLGVTPLPCRVLAPRPRAEDARRLLEELTRAAPLAEEREEER
ncbi:MAG: DUF2007 domain-containing protein [Chloroflexi bacterium]|nr:DUF2007 domain-containing protein [Chloroflexota bacterium]